MKGRKMHTDRPDKQSGNVPSPIPESGVVAYNLREGERPGGLKVRFKVTVVTGQRARELDAQQAEAIRRLLQWAQQHQH
jgi:predicted ABC-class ATPase